MCVAIRFRPRFHIQREWDEVWRCHPDCIVYHSRSIWIGNAHTWAGSEGGRVILKFALYAGRWQLSTIILAPVIAIVKGSPNWFGTWEDWLSAIIANAIGASIFFWVDRFIFTSKAVEMWHVIPNGKCDNCGKETELWRLTLAPGYDKRTDEPKYLCMECSKVKTDKLRAKGIKIRGKSK